jgi:hypothetical protein
VEIYCYCRRGRGLGGAYLVRPGVPSGKLGNEPTHIDDLVMPFTSEILRSAWAPKNSVRRSKQPDELRMHHGVRKAEFAAEA